MLTLVVKEPYKGKNGTILITVRVGIIQPNIALSNILNALELSQLAIVKHSNLHPASAFTVEDATHLIIVFVNST